MKDVTKRRVAFLGGFTAYFVALWFLWDTPVVYPLKIFVVLLHEISHGVVAVATGGTIERIVLDPRQGGACYCGGGSALLTLSAGYLGSLGWGALILTAARERRLWTRWMTVGIGALVLGLTGLYVRSVFGLIFGGLFGAALLAAGRKLPLEANRMLLTVLGLTSCLYAVLDIKSDVIDRPHLESDAHMLGELTGIPTMAWGIVWILIAVGVSGLLFRRAWRKA